MTEPLVYTVEECADALRIGRNQAYALVASGGLQFVRVGRSIRIPRQALDAFLAVNLPSPMEPEVDATDPGTKNDGEN